MEELYIGDLEFYDEVYIGDLEVDIIKLEPETEQIEITPMKEEQIKEGLFDTVIVKGYGNREVRKFNSIEEMNNSTGNNEGDLAVAYDEPYKGITQDSEFQYLYFPNTIVLDEKYLNSITTTFVPYDHMGQATFKYTVNSTTNFVVTFEYGSNHNTGSGQVAYTSNDGITFTRQDTLGFETLDLKVSWSINDGQPWDDIISKFLITIGEGFKGTYKYEDDVWNEIVIEDENEVDTVKRFSSIEDMNNSTDNQEGDLAVVYTATEGVTQDGEFQYLYFPDTIIATQQYINAMSTQAAPLDLMGNGIFQLIKAGTQYINIIAFTYQGSAYDTGNTGSVNYMSSDGITFTKQSSSTLPEVLDLKVPWKVKAGESWDDALTDFFKISQENFEGLFKYENGVWNEIPLNED